MRVRQQSTIDLLIIVILNQKHFDNFKKETVTTIKKRDTFEANRLICFIGGRRHDGGELPGLRE